MIARFRVLLPFSLLIAPDSPPAPISLTTRGSAATVHPPYRSAIPPEWFAVDATVAVADVPARLYPARPQPTSAVHVHGESPCVLADTLQVDLQGDHDRTNDGMEALVDHGFEVANEVVLRLRALVHGQQIRAFARQSTVFHLELLHDDETPLDPDPELLRISAGGVWKAEGLGVSPELWQAVEEAPDGARLNPWDALLLDARDVLPHIGPALVLASSAIETRAVSALDHLADAAGVAPDLWRWINDRQTRKEPSFVERLSVLLESISGKNLKRDEPDLWEGFQNLRTARNSFAHEGVAVLGRREVDLEAATRLVVTAGSIVQWLTQLTGDDGAPPFNPEEMGFHIRRLLVRGDDQPPPSD